MNARGLARAPKKSASPGVTGSLTGSCTYFDQHACVGSSLGGHEEALQLTGTAGQWTIPNGESFDVHLDDLVLRDRGAIFADGFESGDTSVWNWLHP